MPIKTVFLKSPHNGSCTNELEQTKNKTLRGTILC
jgi:hypothetical protein